MFNYKQPHFNCLTVLIVAWNLIRNWETELSFFQWFLVDGKTRHLPFKTERSFVNLKHCCFNFYMSYYEGFKPSFAWNINGSYLGSCRQMFLLEFLCGRNQHFLRISTNIKPKNRLSFPSNAQEFLPRTLLYLQSVKVFKPSEKLWKIPKLKAMK